MRVLVVGGGGREHALCWGLSRSPSVREVICAPGNAGIESVARVVPVKVDDLDGIVGLAERERVDLVVVGPEAPLVAGVADRLRARGLPVFGCSAAAAEIEGSKAFAKELMARHAIPTAAFGVFDRAAAADDFVNRLIAERGRDLPLVVKADGLAAGKGVTICSDGAEAKREARRMLEGALGSAGARVVIEEFLVGREASLMALVHGERVTPLEPAEDHKTVNDGDRGPMTGGMGVVSPTPVMTAADVERALREVLVPTARALVADGRPFSGLLYAGLMLTVDGPRVLEFNCRFGDPETQALIPRIVGGGDGGEDLGAILLAVARGEPPARVRFSSKTAVCVVMTAPGYPGSYPTGAPIAGLDDAAAMPGTIVFHAGTRRDGDRIVTAGGRVLGVTAVGDDLASARAAAYRAVGAIHFEGAHHRTDIGARPRS
jgi:phosphoribosylamine--glycine ligase